MQRHERSPRLRVIALAATLMVGLWQGVALAGPDGPNVSGPEAPSVDSPPAPDAGDAPEAPSAPKEEPSAPSAPSGSSTSSTSQAPAAPQVQQPEPTDQDDSPGHETQDPAPGRHASGEIAAVKLADNDLIVLGRSNAQINEDDSSSADAIVLAIGGREVVASHADSGGETDDAIGPRLVCEQSGGGVCLSLLFAETSATEDDNTSQASADQALVFACVGGDNPEPRSSEDCGSAPISFGASQSTASITKNKRDGSQTATHETTLADVCLGPEGQVDGICSGIGIELIESRSVSSIQDNNNNNTTRDDTGTTERSSRVVGLQASGDEPLVISDPRAISIPPDCPTDPGALVCLFLNQGESFVEVGGAASRQEAVHIALLVADPLGDGLFEGHLGVAETRVIGQDGIVDCPDGTVFNPETGRCEEVEPPDRFCPDGTPIPEGETRADFCPDDGDDNGNGGGDIVPRGGDGGGLAVTGAGLLPLFAVSMILAAGGVGAIGTDRRRRKK